MSKIDRYYFQWDPTKSNSMIKLGDSKSELIKNNLVRGLKHTDHMVYSGINGKPWSVVFKDDKITGICYNYQDSFVVNNTEIIGELYKDVQPVLEKHFKPIDFAELNTDNIRSYQASDILHVMCRDFVVSLIFVIKTAFVQDNLN